MTVDPRVPAYLGCVLDFSGVPVGTCFQASPGVLVTAWHVLDDLGLGDAGASVSVDALNGAGSPGRAEVMRVDPLHDLAALTISPLLPESVAGWFATDWVPLSTGVVVTGMSEVDDPGQEYSHLDAPGEWAGGTTRNRQVPLGRLISSSVLPGMSGAPVRRQSDDLVVGVVSARYNTADGWLEHSVWVSRTEDVRALLDGIVTVDVDGPPPLGGAVDLLLTVSESVVRLTGPGIAVSAPHGGVRPGLAAAVTDVRRERARVAVPARQAAPAGTDESVATLVSLRHAGELVAESFLPGPVATELATVLRRAGNEHVPVRIGIDAPGLSWLPWEAMPDPATFRPLALHPLITVYRKVSAANVRPVPGPLRIVVAIAAPLNGSPVLDYERELRNVLAAVRGARQGDADVRVVPFATTAAIRATLDEAPAHVLHLSCHGGPGILELENEDGTARPVTAKELVDEAIPPGQLPPVICLAACYTGGPAEAGAPSFASELVARGASVVIGAETAVSDWYATALFARVYQELARSAKPDVVAAVADARRMIQRDLAASQHPREALVAGLDEWSVVTVLARSGTTSVFDPTVTAPVPEHRHAAVAGLLSREIGEFVGRRREQRELPALLTGSKVSGIVLHGIGGVGKTTLASELIRRLDSSVVAVLAGELSVDAVLTKVAGAVRRHLAGADESRALRAAQYTARVDEPWQDRFDELREHALARIPLLLVLDNFEDNLTPERQLRDDTLAELLAHWSTDPGRSHLLITTRYPFSLPNQAETHFRRHSVGPLTMAETFKLIWSLPALDRLEDTELERVWRLLGGHPRSLEYLDALLNRGDARYHDVTARLTQAVQAHPEAEPALTAANLDAVLAQTLTLIADDVLLDELLTRLAPAAQTLLLGAAVYREPIDPNALLFQVGEPDDSAAHVPDYQAADQRIGAVLAENGITTDGPVSLDELPPEILDQIQPAMAELSTPPRPPRSTSLDLPGLCDEIAATSLLAVDRDSDVVFVHRWTASELERRQRAQGHDPQQVHGRAAEYWLWRAGTWPQDRDAALHDWLEARHHLLSAGRIDEASEVTGWVCSRLHVIGAWDYETTLSHDTLARLDPGSPQRVVWLHQLGVLAQNRGDYAEAENYYRQTLAIDEESDDRAGIASDYHQLGRLAELRSDYAEAERLHLQSLAIKELLDDRAGMANSHHELGILAEHRGNYAEAERRCRQALDLNEQLNDLEGMALSHHQLGRLAEGRNDFAEAELCYQKSWALNERLGDRVGLAGNYHHFGRLAQYRGDFAEAERCYQQSLAICEDLGLWADMPSNLGQLGIMAQDRGDFAEAERRYQQALAIDMDLGNRAGVATAWSQLGSLAEVREELPDAVAWHMSALALRVQLQVPDAARDIGALLQLRRRMGAEVFRESATTVLEADVVADILGLIDKYST